MTDNETTQVIEKTLIHVDENDVIVKVTGAVTKKGQIPWSRFMAMKRDKALIGVEQEDGTWVNTIHEEHINGDYVEIIRDHTTTARRTVKHLITGEEMVVPTELESALELRIALNKRIKELRKKA